jgi:hypothetical protein
LQRGAPEEAPKSNHPAVRTSGEMSEVRAENRCEKVADGEAGSKNTYLATRTK